MIETALASLSRRRETAAFVLIGAVALTDLLAVVDFVRISIVSSVLIGARLGASGAAPPLLALVTAGLVVACLVREPTPRSRTVVQFALLAIGIGLALSVLLALVGYLGSLNVLDLLDFLLGRLVNAVALAIVAIFFQAQRAAQKSAAWSGGPSQPGPGQQGYPPQGYQTQGRPTQGYPSQSYDPHQSQQGQHSYPQGQSQGQSQGQAQGYLQQGHDQQHSAPGQQWPGSAASQSSAAGPEPSAEETHQFRWNWPQPGESHGASEATRVGGISPVPDATHQFPAVDEQQNWPADSQQHHPAQSGDRAGFDHGGRAQTTGQSQAADQWGGSGQWGGASRPADAGESDDADKSGEFDRPGESDRGEEFGRPGSEQRPPDSGWWTPRT